MKVKILSRNPDNYLRETKRDIQKGELKLFSNTYICIVFLYLISYFIDLKFKLLLLILIHISVSV